MTHSNFLKVEVISPEGIIFSCEAKMVTADTTEGEIGILPGHISLLTILDVGAVVVHDAYDSGEDAYIAVNGGIIEIHNNAVNIVANFAIRASHIDEAAALLEKQKAEAEMETALHNKDTIAYARAKIRLKQAINQINVRAKKLRAQKSNISDGL